MTFHISNFLFYLFAAAAPALAIASVTSLRILRAAVYLMGVLLSTAALYAYLGANVMAGLQVLVYVGGVVVLLVFAVMLTQTNELLEEPPSLVRRFVALIATALFVGSSYAVLSTTEFKSVQFTSGQSREIASANAAAIGRSFLDYGAQGYALPFEIISLLLLAAIIGGIVIATKQTPNDEKTV